MKHTMYDEKRNTLYILTSDIMPKNGKEWKKAWSMSYKERIEKFCTDKDVRNEIERELENHKGCKISEFTTA